MTDAAHRRAQGRCHCGRVRYDIDGPLRQVVECHCESCRRLTGSVWQATGARLIDVTIHDADGALTWYRSSQPVERGFCGHCGSTLFFRRDGAETLTITAGSLDQPSGLELMMRIFTGERTDYAAQAARSEVPEYPAWPPRTCSTSPRLEPPPPRLYWINSCNL